MDKVVAVVVTFNRKALLMECLDSIFAQTRPADLVLLINNASTDGTVETLEEKGYMDNQKLRLINMQENTGGAGGFYEGIRLARDEEPDWVWLMDDDTIPSPGALEGLLETRNLVSRDAAFFASIVFSPDGDPLNVPNISTRKASNGYLDWYRHLDKGCVEVLDATFVSLLINGNAIRKLGLPCRDYFIWGDDSEYTMRLTKYYGPGYFTGRSVVCHKRYGATTLDVRKESSRGRVKLYYHFYKNNLTNKRLYQSGDDFIIFLRRALVSAVTARRFPDGLYKIRIILSGIWGHITGYKKTKAYIESQIEGGK